MVFFIQENPLKDFECETINPWFGLNGREIRGEKRYNLFHIKKYRNLWVLPWKFKGIK